MTQTDTKTKLTPSQIAHRAADVILDKKGKDLMVFDISSCSDLADYMIVATGINKRQVQAIADELEVVLKREGVRRLATSGKENGWWVAIDLGDVLVHVMAEDARRYYDLEALWADARVVRRGVEAA